MSREPVELRFAWQKEDGVHVHTGIYLFDNTTIRELIEFARSCEEERPDWVEISVGDKE